MMKTAKLNKKDQRLALERQRNEWNDRYRLGTTVVIQPDDATKADPRETRTRSQAWIVGGHTCMVMVEGSPGVVPLDSITHATHPRRRLEVVRH